MTIKLSKRLKQIANFVETDARLADIGSDHGYIPLWLVKKGIIFFAIAGEVVPGPYQRLTDAVRSHNLQEHIETRYGSGLDVIEEEDQVDTVIIAGMGGLLIIDILQEGKQNNKLKNIDHLILQPNKDEPELRRWLIDHGFSIEDEALVEDKSKIYEIISAKPGKQENKLEMSEENFKFGLFLKEKYPELFHKKWQAEYDKRRTIKDNILKHSTDYDTNQLEKELEQIREALT